MSHASQQASRTMNDGQWHHYVATVDYLVRLTLYIDGVEAQFDDTFTGTMSNGTQPVEIGRRGDGLPFEGQVDEVRIYNRALSVDEVQNLYNMGR